ncbi:hypothetical protein SprV_0502036700 [Sparganum proliferum]
MSHYEGDLRTPESARFAILASRWNARITDTLVAGARQSLAGNGITEANIDVIRVPGAWELPLVAARLAAAHEHAAILTLGCVIRGDTRHYEHVADRCAEGLMRVQLDFGVPVLNGVLAVERVEDAEARAGGSHGNKGEEVALAALEMGKPSGKPVRRDGVDPVLRSRARRRAVQAIYAWQISGGNAQSLIAQFAHEQAREIADLAYFEALLHGVLDNRRDIDEALGPYLDRGIEEVDAIERAVLRLAAYELRYRLDVPYRVVINEAIESAKRFGSEHGHTYVNGVLDRAAVEWRKVESGH